MIYNSATGGGKYFGSCYLCRMKKQALIRSPTPQAKLHWIKTFPPPYNLKHEKCVIVKQLLNLKGEELMNRKTDKGN